MRVAGDRGPGGLPGSTGWRLPRLRERDESLFRFDHAGASSRSDAHRWMRATISALAVTERLRLRTLSPVTFRRAGELAKVVATATMSGDGIELGLGAGGRARARGVRLPSRACPNGWVSSSSSSDASGGSGRAHAAAGNSRAAADRRRHRQPRSCRLGARYADEQHRVRSTLRTAERKAGRRRVQRRRSRPMFLMTAASGRDAEDERRGRGRRRTE
jgi:hypothetical protein